MKVEKLKNYVIPSLKTFIPDAAVVYIGSNNINFKDSESLESKNLVERIAEVARKCKALVLMMPRFCLCFQNERQAK